MAFHRLLERHMMFKMGHAVRDKGQTFCSNSQYFHCLRLPMLIGVALLVSGRQKQTLRRREIHLTRVQTTSQGCNLTRTQELLIPKAGYYSQLEFMTLNFPFSFLSLEVWLRGWESFSQTYLVSDNPPMFLDYFFSVEYQKGGFLVLSKPLLYSQVSHFFLSPST